MSGVNRVSCAPEYRGPSGRRELLVTLPRPMAWAEELRTFGAEDERRASIMFAS
ncbi:MAG: hypothetical protein H0X66_09225 [Verrucomicrobia bacterium]|nr:hypothetical protein [Verrucomicrobiota bacterium]